MKKIVILILGLVCAFYMAGCSDGAKNNAQEEEKWARIPMVMIDGTLYLDTGHFNNDVGRCGMMDGEITSEVDSSEEPTEDNQSNFGTGYGYQYGATEGTVDLYIDDNWVIFATEEAREKIQFPDGGADLLSATPDYYQLDDDSWACGNGIKYKYKLEISGRMPNAACDSTFVYLSNIKEISFEQAWKAAGLSSNSEDYFDVEDAVLVEVR